MSLEETKADSQPDIDVNVILPQELIDKIIDMVGEPNLDDKSRACQADLRDCSLVCKKWLYRSRKNLFHSMSLNGPQRWCKMKEVLKALPYHAKDVQALYVQPHWKGPEFVAPDEFLLELCEILPCLDELTLNSITLGYPTDNSVSAPFRFESVRTLEIINCSIGSITRFHAIVEAFPSLVSLFLEESGWDTPHDYTPSRCPTLTQDMPNLRAIDIRYDYYWISSFHDWLSRAPHLCIVQFTQEMHQVFSYGGFTQSIDVSKSIECIGRSLVYLGLSSYLFQAGPMCSSLGLCTSLQELTVKNLGPRSYLDNVTDGIRCLRSMKMRQFTFDIAGGAEFTGESERLWKSLDEALHCDRLAKVECVLIKFWHSNETKIRDCFHLTASRGVLRTRDTDLDPD